MHGPTGRSALPQLARHSADLARGPARGVLTCALFRHAQGCSASRPATRPGRRSLRCGEGVTGMHYDRPRGEMFAEIVADAYRERPFDADWVWLD